MKVLIAEDDRAAGARLLAYLGSWGHQPEKADDGRHAWELFKREHFDMLLTDWEMPGLSGIELVRKVREKQSSYVYILMLTSRSTDEEIVQGMEAGADDFVTKPFNKDVLRVRVRAGERILELEKHIERLNHGKNLVFEGVSTLTHIRVLSHVIHRQSEKYDSKQLADAIGTDRKATRQALSDMSQAGIFKEEKSMLSASYRMTGDSDMLERVNTLLFLFNDPSRKKEMFELLKK